jgi:hypothetical protein
MQRLQVQLIGPFLLARPDEIHALGCGTGAGLSQRGFLAGARTHKAGSLDVPIWVAQ